MLEEIKKHYENLLGFSPRRSVLRFLDNDSWDNMCVGLGQNPNSTGIFIPRDLTARVNKDSSDYPLNLFHEYFGHGLFYEYSQIGRFLCNIERRLMEDEKARFRGKSFTLEELLDFRKENPHFRFLRNQENRHLGIYEIFAIWTERYLCDLLNIKDKFEQKYGALSKENRAELERLEEFRKSYGDLALFYEFGMPRYPTQERLLSLLPRVLGGNLGEPKLILIYGSRRAYSDIDLFIVSERIRGFSNSWIDIQSYSPSEFEYRLSVFDIAVTDPILTGEIISGDKGYLEQKKLQLTIQPITREAICYNLIQSKQQRIFSGDYPRGSKKRAIGLGYAFSYGRNALLLAQGRRILTRGLLLNQ